MGDFLCSHDRFSQALSHMYLIFKLYLDIFTVDIHCDKLPAPNNGNVTCSSEPSYVGDSCSFTCITGYELSGSEIRTCQTDGSWGGTNALCIRGITINVKCMLTTTRTT